MVAFSFPFFIILSLEESSNIRRYYYRLTILYFLLKRFSIILMLYIIIDFYLTPWVECMCQLKKQFIYMTTKCYDIESHSQRHTYNWYIKRSLYQLKKEVHLLFFPLMRYLTCGWTSVYHIYYLFFILNTIFSAR
jgi:hypothetical protein